MGSSHIEIIFTEYLELIVLIKMCVLGPLPNFIGQETGELNLCALGVTYTTVHVQVTIIIIDWEGR